jgi:hypothetical protein
MNTHRLSSLFAASLLLSSMLGVTARAEDAATRPDLTGHWVLNQKQSDLPRMGGGPGGGGGGMRPEGGGGWGGRRGGGMRGGGGGGMRGGGGWGGEGQSEGGGEQRGPGGPGAGRMGLPADMVVELADSELTVSERGLAVRKLEFGDVTPTAPAGGGAGAVPSFMARWDGARIVSEFETRRGGKAKETWELSKDGNQLTVRTEMPGMGDRPAMKFKRVYDRSEP